MGSDEGTPTRTVPSGGAVAAPSPAETLADPGAKRASDAGVTVAHDVGRTLPQAAVPPSSFDLEPVSSVLRSGTAPPSSRFVDQGEIGRGGMGSVHRVQDETLLRTVAMKRLDPHLATMPQRLHGFIEEAQIQAQLDHPNVVPIHEIGQDPTGSLYFTMKLVQGRSLAEWLRDPARPVGSPERLADGIDVFLKACDAVAFAHSRGVFHRDLKPDNIMVGAFGEVYVMDWGLAKVVGHEVRLSGVAPPAEITGPFGTPAYMSPEAAYGLQAETDERTDVFGLGAVLYAIVTGQPPYPGDDVESILRAARKGAYVPVETALRGAGVSRRLVRILQKALARTREERHHSVSELRVDVQRFLRGGLHLPRVAFPAGTPIVVEGDVGDTAYIIVSGECEAYKVVHGQRKVLRRMGAGEVFGETAVLSELPRTATVEAITAVTALVVSRAALEEGLGLDSWLGTLVKALAHRFRELDWRLHGG